MGNFKDYKVSKFQNSTYSAYKYNAKNIKGIRFSHSFYFTYCKESEITLNGKPIQPFTPSYNDNYYQANFKEGVVLTTDFKKYVFMDNKKHFVSYEPITLEEILALTPDKEDDEN